MMRISRWPALIVVALALALPAAVLSPYRLGLLALVATYAVASLAQNLLTGYADVLSLGNVTFFGVSAYAAGSLISLAHVPAAAALPFGVAAAGVLGLIVGLPALRISGMHLAVVTVALVLATQELMQQWDQAHSPEGITIAGPSWLLAERGLYLAALGVAALAYLGIWSLLRSRSGRAIQAVGQDPIAASTLGIDGVRYRLTAFVLSGLLTGLAGVIYLYYARTVTPGAFPLDLSLAFLTMAILGGSGSLAGSLLGAIIIGLLPQALAQLPVQIGHIGVQNAAAGFYALLLLLTLHFLPEGLWSGLASRAAGLRQRRVMSKKQSQ